MIWLWVTQNWRVVAVVGVLTILTAGYFIATQRAYNRGYAASENAHLIAQAKADATARDRVAAADRKYTKEIEDAKASNAALRAELLNGARRLSVRATCGTLSNGSRMDHGPGRADIHPADAEALITIGNDADNVARQLTAAQAIIRALLGRSQ